MTTDFYNFAGQPIRRYWVEACQSYYPSGGILDIKGQHITKELADAQAEELRKSFDHVEVHDILNMLLEENPDPSYD